jgi:hypothetical protein
LPVSPTVKRRRWFLLQGRSRSKPQTGRPMQGRLGRLAVGEVEVVYHAPVAEADQAVAAGGYVLFVGGDEHGHSVLLPQRCQQVEDFHAGLGVEV